MCISTPLMAHLMPSVSRTLALFAVCLGLMLLVGACLWPLHSASGNQLEN